MKLFRWFILILLKLTLPPGIRKQFNEHNEALIASISALVFGVRAHISGMTFIMLLSHIFPQIKIYCVAFFVGNFLLNILITYGVCNYIQVNKTDLFNILNDRTD